MTQIYVGNPGTCNLCDDRDDDDDSSSMTQMQPLPQSLKTDFSYYCRINKIKLTSTLLNIILGKTRPLV